MISPLGKLGGYQETTRESFLRSVTVGQSGGEAAGDGTEGEVNDKNEQITV